MKNLLDSLQNLQKSIEAINLYPGSDTFHLLLNIYLQHLFNIYVKW